MKKFVPERKAAPAAIKGGKNDVTELIFILDKSGSMASLTDDTIGGFNSLISKQRGEEGTCLVTTVLFNDSIYLLHDRVPLEEVNEMTREEYVAAGCTALLDATGETLSRLAEIRRYLRPEDVPSKTLVIITTDGMENSSREFSRSEVKKIVETLKEKAGWEFLFLGANIDAIDAAEHIGIGAGRAVNYRADARGTEVMYETMSKAVCAFRANAEIDEDWKDDIENDRKD